MLLFFIILLIASSSNYFWWLFKELNQRIILLMNMMMKNEGPSRQASDKDLKQTSDQDSDELLELLKKTQTEVNALENEFKKVEAENLHQDQGSTYRWLKILRSPFGFQIKIKSWKSLLKPIKTMFIFQFPVKNMLIVALPRMDLIESSQIQISQGNISSSSLRYHKICYIRYVTHHL